MNRKVAIVILATTPLISLVCSRKPERPETSVSERADDDASIVTDVIATADDCPGTVLVFTCDIPDGVDRLVAMGWPV